MNITQVFHSVFLIFSVLNHVMGKNRVNLILGSFFDENSKQSIVHLGQVEALRKQIKKQVEHAESDYQSWAQQMQRRLQYSELGHKLESST